MINSACALNLHRVLSGFCISIFFIHAALAQNIEWSNPQKVRSRNLYVQVLGENASGIYLIRSRDHDFTKDLVIEKYKSNLALELSIPLPINVNGTVERVLLYENFIYVFMSARNSTSGNIELLAQKLDENLKPAGTLISLLSINVERFIDRRNFHIKATGDKGKTGVMYLTYNNDKKATVMNLLCFNDGLAQIYGKQFNLNYEESDIFITSYELSNNGDGFVLLDYPRDEKHKKDNDPRSFYLYGYYQAGDKMLEYDLGQNEFFIEEIGMCMNNFKHCIGISGFYSEASGKAVDGYFYVNIDLNSGTIVNKYFGAVDRSMFTRMLNSRVQSNSDLSDFYIRKIVPRSDGGLILFAEKYYQTRQTYTYYVNNFPQTSTRIIYNFDDVAIMSINPDGKLQFSELVKKNQSSMSDGGYLSSVVLVPTTDYVYVLYNSDVSSDADVMLSYINYEGKIENKIMIKNVNFNAAIIPGESRQITGSSAIICALRDKRFALMRVSF